REMRTRRATICSASRMDFGRAGSLALPFDAAVDQLDQAIRDVVVVIVVAGDDHRLAPVPKRGEDLEIEDLPKLGILVGRPLVEEVDRAALQIGVEESQPLALALREIERREPAGLPLDPPREPEPGEVAARHLVGGTLADAEALEQMEVR